MGVDARSIAKLYNHPQLWGNPGQLQGQFLSLKPFLARYNLAKWLLSGHQRC